MSTSNSLIGISPDDLDARIERAVTRALDRRPTRLNGRPSDAGRSGQDWLTNREALAYLGVSKPTLYRYRAAGRVRYSKVGSNVFYRKADLDAFLDGAAVAARVAS